jgi:serine/threonine protein kinase/Tfp pilus assembly protein PilF
MGIECPKCHFDNPDDTVYCGKCATPLPSSKKIPASPTKTLEAPTEELTTGSTFAGRYQIIEELGKGGMGEVYRVLDKELKEEVALKLIKPEIASDKKTLERFSNELKLARKISHKNVGRMYELMEEKGTRYITMEYVPGEDLKRLIRKVGQFGAGKTISIAKQVCEGLTEAHRLGVVHRDLKPQNIMVDEEGNARILDFGIARSLKAKSITGAGVMIGTPEYMSPEQAEVKEVDQRSDIYSLGVILYEMVTGRVPFEGETPLGIAMKHKSEVPKDPKELNSQIPESLSRVIIRCLEKDKEKRYQSAREVGSELNKIEQGIPTTERVVPKRKPITSREITVQFSLKKLFVPALVFIALIVAGVIIWQLLPRKEVVFQLPSRPSIAVLPFVDLSLQKDQEYFCDGMTDEIIAKLSRLEGLRVIPRTSMMRYKNTEKNITEVAQELDVASILEGSVRMEKGNIRVTTTLINIADSSQFWSETYDRKLDSVFMIQSNIAEEIASALMVKLSSEEKDRLQKKPTENLEAYNLYLLGRFFWNKRTAEGLNKALGYFEQAIEKDATYSLAYVGVADVYNMRASYGFQHPKEAYLRSKAAATKALELDEFLAEAYTSLAWAKNHLDLDWSGAESDYKKAIALNPSYATAHSWYSSLLMRIGRLNEALEEQKMAQELDPLSLPIITSMGSIYYSAREYDKSIKHCKKAIELDPNFHWAHAVLGDAYIQKLLFKEAIEEKQKAVSVSGGSIEYITELAYAYGFAGNKAEALKILVELLDRAKHEYVPLCRIAIIYISLGEMDEALKYLEKAFKEQDVSWHLLNIKVNPIFDSLRTEPRFIALLKKMNLAE